MSAAARPLCLRDFYQIKFSRWTFVVVALGLSQLGLIPYNHGGFYCNDPSLSHKFEGDTITITSLLLCCGLIPLILILAVELLLSQPEKLSFSDTRYKSALRNVHVWYGEYLLAFVFNLMFMDVTKKLVGEPRPHFLDSCSPDAAVNCTTGTYISQYKCTNTVHSKYFVRDSNKSFPSGHTSLSMYLGLFLFSYLQARTCSLRPRIAGPLLQALVVSWTLVCSLSRITDHRHHWWDVLAGGVLGATLCYYSVVVLCKQFVCDNPQVSPSATSNGDSCRSLDNHSSMRRLNSTSILKQEDLDNDIAPVTT